MLFVLSQRSENQECQDLVKVAFIYSVSGNGKIFQVWLYIKCIISCSCFLFNFHKSIIASHV